ncbi:MAG: amidohydrolase family protein, partial [Candidatus Eisenbacteria bacterium]|nr:amidohydrolase family protein [Candidatus Latescibacterota bacterium]MBD3303059.1 amidohydrolase family protein [Candidatus Eisenbacteria bacterium]
MISPPTVYSIEGLLLDRDRFRSGRVTVRGGRLVRPDGGGEVWRLSPEEVLVPGFHDHHTHLAGTHRPPRGPQLAAARSREEALEATAAWLGANPGATPVIGEGWDESGWAVPRMPLRSDLDALAPDRPVVLRRVCGHLAIGNTTAWSALDPRGEGAERETGLLKEADAMGLAERWPPSAEEVLEGAIRGQRHAFEEGVTGIDEMGRFEEHAAYREMARRGSLGLRIGFHFPIREQDRLEAAGIRAGAASGRLRAAGLKGFLDGSFGARTAAVSAPYEGGAETGMLLWETEEILSLARRGAGAGFDLALHAIGDRAVDQAVEIYAALSGTAVPSRLRIEHAEQCASETIDRAAENGIVWSMQPNFTARWQGPEGLYERLLGTERTRGLNRYRTLASRGRLLFGSDTMPLGPLLGI